MSNGYRLEIELPKSDGFHTRDDRHLAQLAAKMVQELLTEKGPTVAKDGEYVVRIFRSEE